MKKILLILLTSLFANTSLLFSQTNVSGGIFTNTIWQKINSPYIVTDTVVVFPGVTLTIEPGVTVKFDSGEILEIRGTLVASGNITDTICFTSNSPSPSMSDWNGIKVIGTTNPLGVGNQVTMEYCKGLYANKFIDLDLAYHGPYIFKHCYFAYNNQVNYDGGMPSTTFDNCYFTANNNALTYCQFASRVSNSSFINNFNGVNGTKQIDTCFFSGHSGIALSPYGKTTGSRVINNNIGVSCLFNGANNSFTGNEVTNNLTGVEILSYFNGSITFTNNTICNNTNYNIKLLTSSNADLSLNCWCSNNISQIKSTILDAQTNISYGLVNISPLAVSCSNLTVGLNELNKKTNSTVNLFPNPFIQNTTLEFENLNNNDHFLDIYDSKGLFVNTIKNSTKNRFDINRNNLNSGLYLYILRDGENVVAKGKFIVQ